jgi:hypothetical protein
MKEANTEPIKISLEGLFQFALNIEGADINTGKDIEANPLNIKEQKTETSISWRQGGKGKNHKKCGGKSSIFKGQELPKFDFCGRKGHTKTACRIKQKEMASSKKDTKDRSAHWKKDKAEKSQLFAAAAASSSTQEDDKDKKAFKKSFMASWKSSQKDNKAQKIKRKRSDNDTSDSEQNYSTSFKLVASKPKRAKI